MLSWSSKDDLHLFIWRKSDPLKRFKRRHEVILKPDYSYFNKIQLLDVLCTNNKTK